MNSFTGAIATFLQKKHGSDLKDVILIFPGRRAGLFLLKEMAANSKKAMFAPAITTLDKISSEITGLSQGDSLPMLYELHSIYKNVTGTTKSFDDFIFQGNTLLSDFNECDNELIDVKKLYTNIYDLKIIDQDYSDNIIYAKDFILNFWQMFIENRNFDMQADFAKLWEKLPLVYNEFTKSLLRKTICYSGMIMRKAAEDVALTENFLNRNNTAHIYFVGFNALTRAERSLFVNFKKSGRASFLWDYDEYYLNDINQEAGTFMRDNLTRFPMPVEFVNDNSELFSRYKAKKNIKVIPVPQITDQARYLEKLAAEGVLTDETAIVLADEKMLIPVIHSLPSDVSANVTMGYAVRNTDAWALLESILTLYKNSRRSKKGEYFRSSDASRVLMHHFFRKYSRDVRPIQTNLLVNRTYVKGDEIEVKGVLKEVFSFRGEAGEYIAFLENVVKLIYECVEELPAFSSKKTELQSLFEIHGQLKNLRKINETYGSEIQQLSTITSLIKRAVSLLTISFRGEPLTGLQIMGFLETRALDFKNVIILSANEGVLPKTSAGGSFIPMTLRQGFRMRTPAYDEAIFAYNFYRLLQRAENVWITWCTGQGITEKAEMSRYLLQMNYDKIHIPEIVSVDNRPEISARNTINVIKDKGIIAKLDVFKTGGKRMSASSVNTYIECPLRFYFSYIAGMREQEEAIDEDMDNRIIGSLFHKAAEYLYNDKFKSDEIVTCELLDSFVEKDYDNAIQKSFTDVLKYKEKNYFDYLSGTEWLYDEIIRRYLKALVKWEETNCPFVYMGHEKEEQVEFEDSEITFYGRIDRLDEKDGLITVSDYKASDLKDLKILPEKSFDNKVKKRGYIFQMFFYQYILSKKYGKAVKTRLISVNKLISKGKCEFENNPYDSSELSTFTKKLDEVLNTLFSAEIPFSQAEDVNACKYCNYKAICNREEPAEY